MEVCTVKKIHILCKKSDTYGTYVFRKNGVSLTLIRPLKETDMKYLVQPYEHDTPRLCNSYGAISHTSERQKIHV